MSHYEYSDIEVLMLEQCIRKSPRNMFGYSTGLEEFVYVVCYEYSDIEK